MKISDLGYDESFLDLFEGNDFELYDHQRMAIEQFRKGKNIMVSVPTAAGKTLIAYSAIYETFKKKLKSIYIVPLRSLAMEKYEELSRLRELGMRVKLSIGNYDDTPDFIKRYDVVILTSEKADSLMHHDPYMMEEVGLMVIDEIHMIGDEYRGPTLETVITTARYVNPETRIIALSATVSNASEIAEWLNASLIKSSFRPVPLKVGILYRNRLFLDGDARSDVDINLLVKETVDDGGQVLIFVSSRKRAEDMAKNLSQLFDPINDLKVSSEDANVYDDLLNEMLPHGVSFHHAGLSNEQRSFIEKAFRHRKLKVIVATPTLAAGVNLPARLVIVKDVTRYGDLGITYLSNMEVKQMIGRAGRPGYDQYGIGIIYAASANSYQVVKEYISEEPEPVDSYIGKPEKVRFNTLAAIAMGLATSQVEMEEFYRSTFYYAQNGEDEIPNRINESIKFLKENGFIKEKDSLRATEFGKMISNLYIDPESAIILKKYFDDNDDIDTALYYISLCREIAPINMQDDYAAMEFLESIGHIDGDIEAAKTALVLREWISEASTRRIFEMYGVAPGDLQARVNNADWISYSLAHLASIFKPERRRKLEILNMRIKEGIREELMDLVLIPAIGRVRARRLYEAGIHNVQELAFSDPSRIKMLYGFSDTLANAVVKRAKAIVSERIR